MNVLPVQWIRYGINSEKLPQTLISVYNFRCSVSLPDPVIVVIFWNWLYTIKRKKGPKDFKTPKVKEVRL